MKVTRDTTSTRHSVCWQLLPRPMHFTALQVGHRQMNVTEKQVELMDIEGCDMNNTLQNRYVMG